MAKTKVRSGKQGTRGPVDTIRGSRFIIKDLLQKRSNKNIYTKILFSNMTVFICALIALMIFASFVVKKVIDNQQQQDLLRKAQKINFALRQLTVGETLAGPSEQIRRDFEAVRKNWEKAQSLFQVGVISKKEYDNAKMAYQRMAAASSASEKSSGKQDLLKLLADIFNARRITIFDRTGNVADNSAEQEATPGGKVEEKYTAALSSGEILITRAVDRETRRSALVAVVPVKNHQNAIENGILLEMKPSTFDFALSRMHLYLVVGGIIVLVIIIFHSVYLAMSIARPISRLATTVAEISRESDVLSVEEQPLDEINALAGQLNKLTLRLQKIQAESRKMEEERAWLFTEISHELRTPLTSVQGFVEAIRDGMVQDKALLERYLDTIYTQTVHIARLVDDILTLGRLESGNISVEKQPLDIIPLAQRVVASFEAEAVSRNTSLRLEKTAENAIVIGDVDRMEQIIRNLLKNALRATENGTIRVCIDLRQGEVVLAVKDDGIGIATEDLPRIWDRFYRVKNQRGSDLREKESSGLGLVIVKKLVQLQGGVIQVESQLGKGTTFRVWFPAFDQR